MAYIYKIVNDINNKIYIGVTKNTIHQRYKEHYYAFKYNTRNCALYRAFKKYGFENFHIELLEECKEENMFEKEKLYIKLYNSYGINGYNETIGGEGKRTLTDEEKDEIIKTYLKCNKIYKTCEILKRNAQTVSRVLNENNIQTQKDIDKHGIIKEYLKTYDYYHVAKKYDVCIDTIRKILKENEIKTINEKVNEELSNINSLLICDLYENKFSIKQISEMLKSIYPVLNPYYVASILRENGYCTDRNLDNKLKLDEVISLYNQNKSISQTAKILHVSRDSLSQYLYRNNIDISSINVQKKISIENNGEELIFNSMIECAKYFMNNNFTSAKSIRGIRDNISKAIKNNTTYLGIKIKEVSE